MDASQVFYTGPALSNIGVDQNDDLDTILNAIDEKFGESTSNPDYTSWSMYGITQINGSSHPTTLRNFSEGIAKIVTDNAGVVTTFIGTTYVNDQEVITDAINAIKAPELTYTPFGITDADLIANVWTKLFSGIDDVLAALDPSAGAWDDIGLTGGDIPDTLLGGFNALIEVVSDLQSTVDDLDALPTFDNTGSCLPTPGATDTLVSTIGKIKTVLCAKPDFNVGDLEYGCGISSSNDNLQEVVQAILNAHDSFVRTAIVSASSEFSISAVDGDPCNGMKIILKADAAPRKTVAATASSTTMGSLYEVIESSDGSLEIDNTDPEKLDIKVNVDALSDINDRKILVDEADTHADYIGNKIQGDGEINGIRINVRREQSGPSCETGCDDNYKYIRISPEVEPGTLMNALLSHAMTDPSLIIKFKQLMDVADEAVTIAAPATGLTVTVI